ncbi:MAG: FIST C-terminal domain-containing protein [Cyanobacteria bacterium REEB65]|nr:FIST C-terminal domain-containing protein [Cyanobacteria bacterium REEB65]
MQLDTFEYSKKSGWSVPEFPKRDSKNTLIIVFGAPEFIDSPEPLKQLRDAYPNSTILGCSSSGEVFETKISDGSLAVAVAQFETSTLKTVVTTVKDGTDSFQAGEMVARQLNDPGLRHIFVLADGLKTNGSHLVQGINSIVDPAIVVTGGLAGDGTRFQRTWVLANGLPAEGFVTAVGLYGDRVRVGHGSMGGFDKFGPERIVTKSEGNTLFELDGKPALELYKTYLGDRANELPGSGMLFPLTIRPDAQDDRALVRTVLAIDENKQSISFAGDIPTGAVAQLMRADFDRLIEGASGAALRIKGDTSGHTLALAVTCVGRRVVLGERTEEEVEATMDVLPKGTRQIGFYSYGEISPYATGKCDLHNQTMTLTTIAEV